MTNINSKTNKADMYKAYRELEAKLNEIKTGSLKDEKDKGLVASIENRIPARIKCLMEAEDTIKYVKSVHNDLKDVIYAIELKKQELKNLAGIEAEVNTLLALTQSNKELEIKHNKLVNELDEEYKKKKEELEKIYEDLENANRTRLQRKYEEKFYELDQKHLKRKNELDNEIKEKEKVIKEKENDINERAEAIKVRENLVEDYENTIRELKEEREKTIYNEVDTALRKQKVKIEESHNHEIEVLKLKKDSEIEKLNNEIEMLDEQVESKDTRIFSLETKLEQAYKELKATADKVIESTSATKYAKSMESFYNKQKERKDD